MCHVVLLGSLIGGGSPVLLSFHSATEDTDAWSGWTDAIVDHAIRWSGYDAARTTSGAAGGAEAAQSTLIDGLSLKRDKTKASIMFRPLLLWVFCQRRLKPKLNVKAILERKMSPPSFFEYLAVSPPCPNKNSSPLHSNVIVHSWFQASVIQVRGLPCYHVTLLPPFLMWFR